MVAEESSHWEVIPVSNEQIPIFLTEPVFNREPEFLTLGNSIVVIKETDGVIFLDYHAAHERINFEKNFKWNERDGCKTRFSCYCRSCC